MLNTPVALSVFNRPDTTEAVVEAIARAKPRQLFVFADGAGSEEEAVECEHARRVAERVDWDCDARFLYSDVNMGARQRYSSGVDWVLGKVEEAIILDDDCVPHPDFFQFCEAMLDRYRDDDRVMMVCGTNYLEQWEASRQSYHFSYFGSVWGWATWKAAWSAYDVDMKGWGEPENQRAHSRRPRRRRPLRAPAPAVRPSLWRCGRPALVGPSVELRPPRTRGT